MTKNERLIKVFTEKVKLLSDKQCIEIIKAIKIIDAVSEEQADQIIPLREAGFTIEQIAERFGVAL